MLLFETLKPNTPVNKLGRKSQCPGVSIIVKLLDSVENECLVESIVTSR